MTRKNSLERHKLLAKDTSPLLDILLHRTETVDSSQMIFVIIGIMKLVSQMP